MPDWIGWKPVSIRQESIVRTPIGSTRRSCRSALALREEAIASVIPFVDMRAGLVNNVDGIATAALRITRTAGSWITFSGAVRRESPASREPPSIVQYPSE